MQLHNNLIRRECLLFVLTIELVRQYNPNKFEHTRKKIEEKIRYFESRPKR